MSTRTSFKGAASHSPTPSGSVGWRTPRPSFTGEAGFIFGGTTREGTARAMANRVCLGMPGKPCGNVTPKPRCPSCQREWARRKNQRQYPTYNAEWRKQAKAIKAEWIATYGYWCPGMGEHQPHPSTDLVVDHHFGVCCRRANAVKANTLDRGKPLPQKPW